MTTRLAQHATQSSCQQTLRLPISRCFRTSSPHNVSQKISVGRSGARVVQRVHTNASASELAEKFNIPECVSVSENEHGLIKVKLTHASGTTAEVYLYGACTTSWKQPSGDEILYVRPDSKWDGSKPISGGVPFCFPQFGPGKIQQHGFARNLTWTLSSTSADLQPDERDPEVTLTLESSDETRNMWPYEFKAVHSVSLHGEQLKTDFRVINTDSKELEFTAALHTYIGVSDISKAKVDGLKGLQLLDKVPDVNNPVKREEERDLVEFEGPVDSVYLDVPDRLVLEVGTGAGVEIQSKNWKDAVVWNPHTAMDCYKEFACLENAVVGQPVKLAPGQDWRAEQTFSVIDL